MEFTYQLNREIMKTGASYHYIHSAGKWRYLHLFGGATMLMLLAVLISLNGLENQLFACVFSLFLGLSFTFRKSFTVHRTVKSFFQNSGTEQLSVEASANEEGFSTSDSLGHSSKVIWKGFIDCVPFPEGVLLYPQKNLFFWIPVNSQFQSGSWGEFTALLNSKIARKA